MRAVRFKGAWRRDLRLLLKPSCSSNGHYWFELRRCPEGRRCMGHDLEGIEGLAGEVRGSAISAMQVLLSAGVGVHREQGEGVRSERPRDVSSAEDPVAAVVNAHERENSVGLRTASDWCAESVVRTA